jgi:hypothetical protein
MVIDGADVKVPAWDMFAPTTYKLKGSEHYPHPPRLNSIDDCNELWRTERCYVLERCKHFILACKKAPLDPKERGTPQNLKDLWHIIDAFRYPMWRAQAAMDPKRKPRGERAPSPARRSIGGRGRGQLGSGLRR